MIDEHFALHARSFVNFALHARSLFERTLHSHDYGKLQIGESLVTAVEIWIFRKIIKTPGMEQNMFIKSKLLAWSAKSRKTHSLLNSMPGVSAFIWYDWMIDEHFALHARSLFERTLHSHARSFVNFALHARSLFERTYPNYNIGAEK
jgi:hypothetical protein